MNDDSLELKNQTFTSLSPAQALRLLDQATDTLEGLDELGVSSRAEVVALMNKLERLIEDEN